MLHFYSQCKKAWKKIKTCPTLLLAFIAPYHVLVITNWSHYQFTYMVHVLATLSPHPGLIFQMTFEIWPETPNQALWERRKWATRKEHHRAKLEMGVKSSLPAEQAQSPAPSLLFLHVAETTPDSHQMLGEEAYARIKERWGKSPGLLWSSGGAVYWAWTLETWGDTPLLLFTHSEVTQGEDNL